MLINTVIGAALGFTAAIFSEPLRHWFFSPKLKLVFGNDLGCRARTPEQMIINQQINTYDADYIRIKVINTKPAIAKSCRVYLVNIERLDDTDKFRKTIYEDSIPLSWACRGDKAYVH